LPIFVLSLICKVTINGLGEGGRGKEEERKGIQKLRNSRIQEFKKEGKRE
jgi:hypothetical protein